MKSVVLHGHVPPGAAPDEQDVLVEVEAVCGALEELGYDPVPLSFSLDIPDAMNALRRIGPALVFNLVESVEGQGQLIYLAPALLDLLRLPYTGAPTPAIFLTSNKPLAKTVMAAAGIPTPRWVAGEEAKNGRVEFNGPYIVKAAWEHASIGLDEDSVVTQKEQLHRVLEAKALLYPGGTYLEAFVDGREFNLSLLGGSDSPLVLPPAEIRFEGFAGKKPKIVGYRAKWEKQTFEYQHTVRSFAFSHQDQELLKELSHLARCCWSVFGLRGYARVDFRVDRNGKPWVLEINANPCLSPDGGLVAAAQTEGIGFVAVVERILSDAFLGSPNFSKQRGTQSPRDGCIASSRCGHNRRAKKSMGRRSQTS